MARLEARAVGRSIKPTDIRVPTELGGGMVAVDDLADEWKAPNPWPDWLDDSMFG